MKSSLRRLAMVSLGWNFAIPRLPYPPPPPCFSEKRLQVAENKGNECEKERQERARGGKLMKRRALARRHRDHREYEEKVGSE
jgi:hypothetical protein